MIDQEQGLTRQSLTIDAAGTAIVVTAVTNVAVTIRSEFDQSDPDPDCCVIRLSLETEPAADFTLHELSFEWDVPVVDMRGLYFGANPGFELAYLPFWNFEKSVSVNSGVPFLALIDRTSKNRFAFGLADQITETRLHARLSELSRCFHFTVRKPVEAGPGGGCIPMKERWVETVFVSTQERSWPEVLRSYTAVVDGASGERRFPVPEAAYAPVYCSWYAIHHDVSDAWVRRQAALAAELGFGTWITDDGWFIEHGQFADYSKVGEWEPSAAKFPDFRAHVAAVQELGLRYLLWVAPFMVGVDSLAAEQYRDLLIPGQERERFDNLSPWQPETRRIVTDLLARLVTDYGLDGLKIDFLDSVRNHNGRSHGADGASFGEGFYRIMAEAVDALEKVNPELLIEFRNSYSNLASRRYANLYRSSDVPFNSTLNRWQAVLMRLLVPDRAVQLDPMIWHPDESEQDVAVHLINSIVAVPTISIDLELYPESHLQLIRHWLDFYNRHRDTLVHGEFRPVLRPGNVPAVAFAGDDETIVAIYDDAPVVIEPATRLWLINASTRPYVEISECALDGARQVVEHDKFGNAVTARDVSFPQARLGVEVGGTLEIMPR